MALVDFPMLKRGRHQSHNVSRLPVKIPASTIPRFWSYNSGIDIISVRLEDLFPLQEAKNRIISISQDPDADKKGSFLILIFLMVKQ